MKIPTTVVVLVSLLVYGKVTTAENENITSTIAVNDETTTVKTETELEAKVVEKSQKQTKKSAITPGIASYLQGIANTVTTRSPNPLGNNGVYGQRPRPNPKPQNSVYYERPTSPTTQRLVTWRTTKRSAVPLSEDKLAAIQFLQLLEQQEQAQQLQTPPPQRAPPPQPPYHAVKPTFKPIPPATTEFEYSYEYETDVSTTTTTTTAAPARRRRRRTTTIPPSYFGGQQAQQQGYLPPQQQRPGSGGFPAAQQSGFAPNQQGGYQPQQNPGYPVQQQQQQAVYPVQPQPGHLPPQQRPGPGYPSGFAPNQPPAYTPNQPVVGYPQQSGYPPLHPQQKLQQPAAIVTTVRPRRTSPDYYDYLDSLPSTTWKPTPVLSGQTYPITSAPGVLNPALVGGGVQGLSYQQLLQLQRIKQYQYLMSLQKHQLANQTYGGESTTEYELYKKPDILINPYIAPTRITSTTENSHDAIHNIGGIFGSLATGNLAGVVDSTIKLGGTGFFQNFNTWAACSIMKRCGGDSETEDEEAAEVTTIKVPQKPPQDRYPVRRPFPIRY